MQELTGYKEELFENGFTIIDNVFSDKETEAIIATIQQADATRTTFRKTTDLFAIRQFLKEIPEVVPSIFTERFCSMLKMLIGKDYFVVKSIYFDKPGASNWFVAYHQDLTISVTAKATIDGFGPWTVKQNGFAVQPPLDILKSNVTVRIHLDETDEHNGALRVIPQSHRKGIYRPETIDWTKEKEVVCHVPKGGLMLMQPLLLHASGRTTNSKQRRVIHIECSNKNVPWPLQWSELMNAEYQQQ